jgi:hypothetical protein
MLSPYQRAKSPSTFKIPEVRHELLHSQRLLYRICTLENEGDLHGAERAQDKFSTLVSRGFPEGLHDLVEDVHIACDWALGHSGPKVNVLRAAILFTGALLKNEETSTAIPILRKLETATNGHRELTSLWAINSAIGLSKFSPGAVDSLWDTAIREMPLGRWMHYPSLANGCREHIRKLRLQHQENGDLQSLLTACPLAERAYAALTHRSVKGTEFETSREVVTLLVELAQTQRASSDDGFGALEMPGATELMELAVINAAANGREIDLFTTSLTILAQHYATCGEREKARNTAVQALAECTDLPTRNPEMIRLLQVIFEANKDDP